MATLESLSTSITRRSPQELITLFTTIRAQRRKRPEPKERKVTAKSTRAASKKAPRQQDLFALVGGMSQADKDIIAASLLEMMK